MSFFTVPVYAGTENRFPLLGEEAVCLSVKTVCILIDFSKAEVYNKPYNIKTQRNSHTGLAGRFFDFVDRKKGLESDETAPELYHAL